ncbi:MAG TPA: nucleoside monophosphate kinase [Patescibacteria group bacterium]|nr:nucleoside monophosphate kinase [Patescibacteria group bacterium]
MIILLGVPGSGKSTQGQLLTERGRLRWLSMGEILRKQASGEHQKQMKAGKLLASAEVIKLLDEELQKLGDNPELILDGFPRYIDQAEWLLNQRNEHKIKLSAVINLFAAEEVVEARLMLRGRLDDNSKTISSRFDVYKNTAMPVIERLKQGGVPIIEINADQIPEAILEDIIVGLKEHGIEV